MDARAIAFAIPIFFLLIGVELALSRGEARRERFDLHDSIASLSCGIGQQALGFFFKVFQIGAYTWVYDHLRLTTISERSVVAWVVLLFALDLGYYVYHWASHRVNFLWAMHEVHHQSEEYNLTTALRQSWFTSLASWVFYVPLAIAGFPPLMFVLMYTFNTLYQFWIHTRGIGRLGPLEAILNTPSHHRVHHGINPICIDRNYAGIFILWDKLFGTFQREEEEPVYGLVGQLHSFHALWANFEPFVRIYTMARQTKRLRDKIAFWFAPPEWRPADLGGPVTVPETSRAEQVRYRVKAPPGADTYVIVSFVLVTAVLSALLWYEKSLPIGVVIASVGAVIMTLSVWAGLFERRAWAAPLEWIKLALAVGITAWITRPTAVFLPVTGASAAAAIVLALWVSRCRGPVLEAGSSAAEAHS